jgi:molybdate-binding protein
VRIETEDYDLVMPEELADDSLGRLLLETIRSPAFAAAIGRLSGYDTSRTGTVKR